MDTTNTLETLKSVPAGFLPEQLFNQIARLGVLAYFEVIAFRLNQAGNVEVLLTRRSEDDPFWPNMYHNPGTVLRPNDKDFTFSSAIARLFTDEYAGAKISGGPYFAGFWFQQLERGKGLGLVSWIELNDCNEGKYFAVDAMPQNMISGQTEYIKKSAKQFMEYKLGKFRPTKIEDYLLN